MVVVWGRGGYIKLINLRVFDTALCFLPRVDFETDLLVYSLLFVLKK